MKSVKIILLTLFAELIFVQTSSSQSDVSKYKFGGLTVLADKYGTDKGSIGHLYTEVYEYFFLSSEI